VGRSRTYAFESPARRQASSRSRPRRCTWLSFAYARAGPFQGESELGEAEVAWCAGAGGPARTSSAADGRQASYRSVTPTVFHVTHPKSGSQWIYKILSACTPNLIVRPELDMAQVTRRPIEANGVYPAVYLTRDELDAVSSPGDARRFVVIRDLRDTLVSLYYSLKLSHPTIATAVVAERARLRSMTVDDGLIYLIDNWLEYCSRIQQSWIDSGEHVIRYEDLLDDDLAIFERVLIHDCGLPLEVERLREAGTGESLRTADGRTASRRRGQWRSRAQGRRRRLGSALQRARQAGLQASVRGRPRGDGLRARPRVVARALCYAAGVPAASTAFRGRPAVSGPPRDVVVALT
jgi:hypothetical protein